MLESINSFSVRGLGLRLASLILWPLLLVTAPVLGAGFIWWDVGGRLRALQDQPERYWNERHPSYLVRFYCVGLHLCWNGLRRVMSLASLFLLTALTPFLWLFTGKRYIMKSYRRVGRIGNF